MCPPSESVCPTECPGPVGRNGNADFEGFLRENFLYILRPFHQAQASAVNIIVETYVKRFGNLGYTVKVEMEDGRPVACTVFVHNGESRGTDSVRAYSESPAYGCGKGCLPCSHRCVESDQDAAFRFFEKSPGGLVNGRQIPYCYFVCHFRKQI